MSVIEQLSQDPRFDTGAVRPDDLTKFRLRDPLVWVVSRLGGLIFGGPGIEVVDTFSYSPALLWGYVPLAVRVVPLSSLGRLRCELATQRTVWNSGCRFEWYYHAHWSRATGFSTDTVERVTIGPDADGWTEEQRLILRAVDDLHEHGMISPEVREQLSSYLSAGQIADLCMLVGHYEMISMLFKTFGNEPDMHAYQRGPLAWVRPADDSDRVWPTRRFGWFNNPLTRAPARRLPHHAVLTAMDGTTAQVAAFPKDGTVSVLLPRGVKADWVRSVLDGGSGSVNWGRREAKFTNPRIIDGLAVAAIKVPFSVRVLSYWVNVLVAELDSQGHATRIGPEGG